MKNLAIRLLEARDVPPISAAFDSLGWNKPRSQYERYLSEQQRGVRAVFVALVDDAFAGYVSVNGNPTYPPFRDEGIPQIQDFNVLPRFRRQGIGTQLMDEVSQRSTVAGIGVGMSPDYGAAQRLYVLRGYVPDAQGLTRSGSPVKHGDDIVVNEALVLYLTKSLTQEPSPAP